MDDMRFQKVEITLNKHSAQLKQHERLHESYDAKFGQQSKVNDSTVENLKALTSVVTAIHESVKAQEKNTAASVNLTKKIEQLAEALGIIGTFAKWVIAVSGMCTLIIGSIKGWWFK